MDFETINPFHSTSTPPSSPTQPSPPPISVSVSQRNPADRCFGCGKCGHWIKECPNKITKKSHPSSPNLTSSSSSLNTCDVLLIRCPCGRGKCRIFTSHTQANPERKFYTCPVDKSSGSCGFFKWCDELSITPPICPCGAGFCSLNRDSTSPYEEKWYFACRIKKSHGACPFVQYVDSEVNAMMKRYVGGRRGHTSLQFNNVNNDLEKKEVTVASAIEVAGNIDSDMKEDASEIELPVIIAATEQDESPCGDQVMQGAESWDPVALNTLEVFHQTPIFQSESHRLKELWKQISASGNMITGDVIYQISGLRVSGWLGRFAFPPSQYPKDSPVMPIFCCVFPSFDPVTIPEDVDICDAEGSFLLPHSTSNAETDTQTTGQNVQEPSNAETDTQTAGQNVQGLKDSAVIKENDTSISKSVLNSYGQALLNILESMNPPNHEAMVKLADDTFNIFKNLSIQCDPFVEGVKEYIQAVSKLPSIEKSMPKGLSSKELSKLYDAEKLQFDNVSRLHTEAVTAYKASNNHLQSLQEELSSVKARLLELEKQLCSCESETSALKSHLGEVAEDMLESQRSMEAASNEMVEALKLEQQKESVLDAARAAMETARIWIQH
ncbi:hypothetical protein JCGZ_26893 [Jatropha curcas]|uniref:CCHC-type domain-containing protein n=2 Tax=Jatropha curcas TaxID=180498 RepID=A0A067LBK4_JATCU|nr:hypothetical protein JCGZ_26893 [Jatropha curcas]